MIISDIRKEQILSAIITNLDDMKGKNVAIFGTNDFTKYISDVLKFKGIEIDAILDNDKKKQGKYVLETMIVNPNDYLIENPNSYVIFCSKFANQMRDQLEKNSIFCYLDIPYRIITEKDKNTSIEEEYEKIEKGYSIYNHYMNINQDNERIFLLSYKGLGDAYLTFSFLEQYCNKNNIKTFTLLVMNSAQAQIAEMYNIKNTFVICSDESYYLMRLYQFVGPEKVKIKPLKHWADGWWVKNNFIQKGSRSLTFIDRIKYCIFELNEEAKPQFPVIKKTNYAQIIFEKNKLEKGRTLIIAPYAGTVDFGIPLEVWQEVIKKFKKSGFGVCTNCSGEEKPLENTVKVSVPINRMEELVSYAGYFLSVRSGICDVVCKADCKMAVIYENGFASTSSDYYGLKKMGICENEFVITYETEESFIELYKEWRI